MALKLQLHFKLNERVGSRKRNSYKDNLRETAKLEIAYRKNVME
jgi:hypothetical protein